TKKRPPLRPDGGLAIHAPTAGLQAYRRQHELNSIHDEPWEWLRLFLERDHHENSNSRLPAMQKSETPLPRRTMRAHTLPPDRHNGGSVRKNPIEKRK